MQVAQSNANIRACADVVGWQRCVELQREVWNFDPAELVPVHVLAVAFKTGGQVLGAFDEQGSQVGFALSFPAFRGERRYLHSHMLAVLPQWQNRGVGRQLKLAQRDEALARGIDLIEWTFDPLEVRNAYFNLARLGAIVRRYIPDLYGPSSSPLHRGLPTDRLVAEWWLNAPRVIAATAGEPPAPLGKAVAVALPAAAAQITPEVQARIRGEFADLFSRGYAATGFSFSPDQQTGSYLLEPYED